MPGPSEAEAGFESGADRRSSPRTFLRTTAILLLIAAAGFGQGLGVMLLFDAPGERLNAPVEGSSETGPTAEPAPAAGGVAQAPASEGAQTRRHVLELGHERFEAGDIEGARRIASSFLLQLDGQAAEDVRREPEALALLGDVLRYEYERSLLQARPADGDAAAAEAAEGAPEGTEPAPAEEGS